MTEPLRPTPTPGLSRGTPEIAQPAIEVVRARVAAARTLGFLVFQIQEAVRDGGGGEAASESIRDALRQLAASVRTASVTLTFTNGALSVAGVDLNEYYLRNDRWLVLLSQAMQRGGLNSISVREAAAPAELVTLARLLARTSTSRDTPIASDGEVFRSWSVVVTAAPVVQVEPLSGAVPAGVSPGGALPADVAAAALTEVAQNYTAITDDYINTLIARNDLRTLAATAVHVARLIRTTGAGRGRTVHEHAMRRLLRKDVIAVLATLVPDSADRDSVTAIFARAGETGVQFLLNELIAAKDAVARRSYFDTIVAIDQGGELLRNALTDQRWYVVRNACALISEMRINGADSELAQLLYHSDSRIRIAAARALLRLRTQRALTALHAAINDSNPEVRRLAATSFSTAAATAGHARPPVTALAQALDHETDEDVALGMMAAMGKLGSADAVQRLLRIAQSPTEGSAEAIGALERGYIPRPSWVRAAALEALVDARGVAVVPAVQALTRDGDEMVAGLAAALLEIM